MLGIIRAINEVVDNVDDTNPVICIMFSVSTTHYSDPVISGPDIQDNSVAFF